MSDFRENKYLQQDNEYDHLKKVIEIAPLGRAFGFILKGPPGTGKTLCAITLARDFGAEYFIVDGSNQIDRLILEGNWEIIKDKGTVFTPGALTKSILKANENGIAFLIINEINSIRPNEQISLNSLLSESHINLISDAGRRVQLDGNAKLIVIGTMNLKVLGINRLQEAFDDRFFMNKEINYPSSNIEVEIVTKISNCSKSFASIIVEAGQHLRNAAIRDLTIGKVFSTRTAVNFSYIVNKMGVSFLKENIEAMIINKLSEEETEKESIRQLLDGINFEERVSECFTEKVEEELLEVTAVITTKEIVQRISRIVKNECYPNFKVFRGGKFTYQTLEYLWKNHKAAAQEYFLMTDEMDLFKQYEEEEGKSPVYGGELTFTYIYWLYQKRMPQLINFISNLYPIL